MSLPAAVLDGRAQNGDVPEIDPAARPQRWRFSAEYKQISEWRLSRDAAAQGGIEPRVRKPRRSATEVDLGGHKKNPTVIDPAIDLS